MILKMLRLIQLKNLLGLSYIRHVERYLLLDLLNARAQILCIASNSYEKVLHES